MIDKVKSSMLVEKASIPLCVPVISGNEWEYVKECLDTGWISSAGSYVDRFEGDVCGYTGAKHAIACVNGTAALQTALEITGTQQSDEVLVPTVTFIASVNAVSYIGARPVFMDCDEYYNIDVEKVLDFVEKETVFRDGHTYNKITGRRVSAIVIVHVFGNAVNIEPLINVCKERNIKVIEDAAESIGSYYTDGLLKDRHTGTIGDVGCYSFNGNKIITAGGGAMIVTNNREYAQKARYLTTQAKDDQVRYIHNQIGYNYRLTNIQAALGVAQLERLDEFIAVKKENYNNYKCAVDGIFGLHLTWVPAYAKNNYWMYALQIKEDYKEDKEALMERLASEGIQTRPVWYLNHLQKPYKDCQSYKIEKAYQMHKETLTLPCSVSLMKQDIDYVASKL